MERPLSFFRMHWDHEPADRAAASCTAPVPWRFRLARLHRQSARRLSSLPKKTPAGHALSILSICLIFSVSTVADARLVYPQSLQPGSFTGLLGGFGCLAHGFLGKDESPLALLVGSPPSPKRQKTRRLAHSKRFALAAKAMDYATAFGVRASSAPLSQDRLQFHDLADSWQRR